MRVLFDLVCAFDETNVYSHADRYAILLAKAMLAEAQNSDNVFAMVNSQNHESTWPIANSLTYPARLLRRIDAAQDLKPRLEGAIKRRVAALAGAQVYMSFDPFIATSQPTFDSDYYCAKTCGFLAYQKTPQILSPDQRRRASGCDFIFTASQNVCDRWNATSGVDSVQAIAISGAGDPFFQPTCEPFDGEEFFGEARRRSPFVFAVADTKQAIERIHEAWALLDANVRENHLLLIEAPAPLIAEYRRIWEALSPFDGDQPVLLTGLSRQKLLSLYNACALFVFCACNDGFGLPILEAMQCAAPVIVADDACFAEIITRSEQRFDFRNATATATAMHSMLSNANLANAARDYGLIRAKDFAWKTCARRAWEAIAAAPGGGETRRRNRPLPASLKTTAGFEAETAHILNNAGAQAEQLALAAAQTMLKAIPSLYDPSQRRLFVDTSTIIAHDKKTGIQRVVRRLTEALYRSPESAFSIVATQLKDDRFASAESFVAGLTGSPHITPDAPLGLRCGDILLLLDNSWDQFDRFAPVIENLRAAGGQSYAVVYDLIPILWRGASVDAVPQIFEAWLRQAVMACDGLIAISQTVARELETFLSSCHWPVRSGLKIGWWRLGADFTTVKTQPPSQKLAQFFDAAQKSSEPVFLVVGTIEPRKGHSCALTAFNNLWREGFSGRLAFIGRKGWNMEGLTAQMAQILLRENRFAWFDEAHDADLAYAYQACAAVIAPSYAEGYGLPLSEAAHYQKDVICSDIPVFREIGADGAIYFRCNDDRALAQIVQAYATGAVTGDPHAILRPSWAQSAEDLLVTLQNPDRWRVLGGPASIGNQTAPTGRST